MRSYLAANGGSDAEVMGENFSSSGRSNERFAGLMEKIRFPSGYLLFEIWKSGAKKRERRRRRKHDGREKRGKSRDGRKQTRGLRWVFRWILCSVRSCWTTCVECVVC